MKPEQRSAQLIEQIKLLIDRHQGAISFVDFMEAVLYTPALGYYSGQTQQFGEGGDFTTAPELSSLFGQCLAKQCQQVLQSTGGDIIEFGAGRGKLALDILQTLKTLDCLPEHYYIIDVSDSLVDYQQQFIKQQAPDLFERVQWLKQLPDHFNGVVIANEVLDAMPVHRFHYQDQHLSEYFVSYNDDGFQWQIKPATKTLATADTRLQQLLINDYDSEINLQLPHWFQQLSQSMQQGLVLLIDYGFPEREFYHPERSSGTLMCHYQHQAHPDPLLHIGLQDITAHVDFTAVAEAAHANDFDIAGYTNQASFLMDCGILQQPQKTIEQQYTDNQAIKKLLLPSEMGELFKVLALSKNYDSDLLGFVSNDQLMRL